MSSFRRSRRLSKERTEDGATTEKEVAKPGGESQAGAHKRAPRLSKERMAESAGSAWRRLQDAWRHRKGALSDDSESQRLGSALAAMMARIEAEKQRWDGTLRSVCTEEELAKRYLIMDEEIGRGAFGTVHKVIRMADARALAVKILTNETNDPKQRGEAIDECVLWQKISSPYHPSILPLLEVTEVIGSESIHLLTELMSHGDLRDALVRMRPMSEQVRLDSSLDSSLTSGRFHAHTSPSLHSLSLYSLSLYFLATLPGYTSSLHFLATLTLTLPLAILPLAILHLATLPLAILPLAILPARAVGTSGCHSARLRSRPPPRHPLHSSPRYQTREHPLLRPRPHNDRLPQARRFRLL